MIVRLNRIPRHYLKICFLVTALLLAGCASKTQKQPANPQDPFEPFNRQVYSFNRGIDRFFIKPVAVLYRTVFPDPVRKLVTNFFGNLDDLTIAANKVLQLEVENALRLSLRILVNSTVGVGGLFDVASTDSALQKQRGDFGVTLAKWGIMKDSPYLVLPILGPSTVRDTLGWAGDWVLSPYFYWDDLGGYELLILNILNVRANLLEDEYFFDYASMDSYSFIRDVYLQRRAAIISNQDPGKLPSSDDWNDAENLDDWQDAAIPAKTQ